MSESGGRVLLSGPNALRFASSMLRELNQDSREARWLDLCAERAEMDVPWPAAPNQVFVHAASEESALRDVAKLSDEQLRNLRRAVAFPEIG